MATHYLLEDGELIDVEIPDAEAARLRERAFWQTAILCGLAGTVAVFAMYVWVERFDPVVAVFAALFFGPVLGFVGGLLFRDSVERRLMTDAARRIRNSADPLNV